MEIEKNLLLFLSLAALLYDGNGCQIDGVTNWLFIEGAEMYDYFQGTLWSRAATNIAGITNFSPGGGVSSERYISAALQDGNVTLSTTANYPQYEETETSDTMSFTLTFSCTDGTINLLTFEIKVIDTNNNDPKFLPDDTYEFTVLPPLPPGFEITGCGQDIVVRDIDLTTSSIIFSIEENPYLEVVYEGRSPTEYKQFLASLRTKDLIRTLPEDVELTISATDVDQTGDPPRTSTATIKLKADDEFQFPEEPVFSQPLYLAAYVDNQVILQKSITLQQGFDKDVAFSLDEDQLSDPNLSNYFGLTVTGNQVSISVTSLPDEVVKSGQVILVIRADRQYTSGDRATVIIRFPEVPTLEFEDVLYTGRIIDNILQPIQLNLKEGYEEDFSVSIQGEYASFFSTTIQGNAITLLMTALNASVFDENNFLTLQVSASNAYSSTAAVVTLDIVKDDTGTPLFEKPIYVGEYAAETGFTIEQITLVQGYDENVSFSLQGDHAEFFQLTHDGATVTVTSSSIPVEIWAAQHILLIVGASKPRTITSTATLSISLPPARKLSFGAPIYSGTLRDNLVSLSAILLSSGYDKDVNFQLEGDYARYFTASNTENQVLVNVLTALPDDVISQNNFLALTLRASGIHALSTSTTLILQILKQDLQTPVFTENVYRGTFENNYFELGSISLMQGYDSTVTFKLQGEHSQYFRLDKDENNVTLELESEIPADVIFSEKVFVFTVLADKPLTVGAKAAVSIAFSEELTDAAVMGFSQTTYVGYLANNELNLDDIVLQTGYAEDTELSLSGEYVSFFSVNNTENVITISITKAITEEIIANNKYIVLELKAERERAVPVTVSIIIDIIEKEIVMPVFSKPYYKTLFSNGTFEEKVISLSQGYDETVSYALEGEHSIWFKLTQSGEDVVLSLDLPDNPIPEVILESNTFFLFTILAHKSRTTSARATVFVDIPKELSEFVIIRFTQSSYVGRIENKELYTPRVTLLGEQEPVAFIVTGDYAQYFEVTQTTPTDVQILLSKELPVNIHELAFILIDIEAQYPDAISGHTSVVFEVVKQPLVITPVFEQAYYTGEFSAQELQFDQSMRLIQGFDESVVFTLAGDDAQFFELMETDNNTITLTFKNELEQITDRSHLTFSIVANKADSVPGMAAIIISLSDFPAEILIPLRFTQNVYRGSIENGSLSINNIILEEGYSPDVSVDFTGDHVAYFQLTDQEGTFTLELSTDLPADILEANNFLVFGIEVQLGDSKTHTTVILEIIKSEVGSLAFEEAYYVGSYSITSGFIFDPQITLTGEYDETVSVSLEGDDAEYFEAVVSGNSISLRLNATIPGEVMLNRHQLIFSIHAIRASTLNARATVIISLITDSYTELSVLRFEQAIYLGSIENDTAHLEVIKLVEGYNENVIFELFGDLSSYFSLTNDDDIVSITLRESIPEDLIPDNKIIIYELQAISPDAISARAAVVFQIVRKDILITRPIFSKVYYIGQYNAFGDLTFPETIKLSDGYDESVQFSLQGDHSQYFALEFISENEISLRVDTLIPTEVLINNHQLIFTVHATKSGAATAIATIIISVLREDETSSGVSFDKVLFQGTIENGTVIHETITVNKYDGSDIEIINDYAEEFIATITDGEVIVQFSGSVNLLNTLTFIPLQLRAGDAETVLLLEIVDSDNIPEIVFDKSLYQGRIEDGTVSHETISLSGFDGSAILLDGDHSDLFTASFSNGVVTVQTSATLTLPATLSFVALELRAGSTSAVLVLDIIHSGEIPEVAFDKSLYQGRVEDGVVTHETISLTGFDGSAIILNGDYSDLFTASITDGIVTVQSSGTLPTTVTFVALQLKAGTTSSVLVLDVIYSGEIPEVAFDKFLYQGSVKDGVVTHETITLTGFDGSNILLSGDYSDLFTASITNGVVMIRGLGSLTLPATLRFVALELRAGSTSTVLVLDVIHSGEIPEVAFDKYLYQGRVEDGIVTHETISLTGFDGSDIILNGDYSDLFTASITDGIVTVESLETLPATLSFVALELRAGGTSTVLVLDIIHSGNIPDFAFDKTLYQGGVEDGVVKHETITLTGFDGSNIILEGDYSDLFTASITNGVVTVQASGSLTLPATLTFVALELKAGSSSAVLLLDVIHSGELPAVTFDKTLYQGRVIDRVVIHETITLSGYSGSSIQLNGEYAVLFTASVSDGVVTVENTGSVTLPANLAYIALELEADGASAVLLLEVTHNETPAPPIVTFDSPSYILRVDVTQTGVVGRVEASADNGEDVTYSLSVDDSHLLERISISSNGELYLSAPASSGAYSFQVVATTVFSDATGTAPVHLTVEAITVCSEDNYILPPLQIFDRDEESSYSLISLNQEEFPGCRYTLSNRWPSDQQWLYVDETGLHTRSIDREHPYIAFMALSQVQVELTLECDSDGINVRTKRSIATSPRIDQLDHLGPYDYGPYKWILTDSILHDSRKSIVNLIVNDINDNYPIFEGVENQPVTVGWPVPDLEERIVPRYLTEVKASDADVGENAAIVYWSNEEMLAVSPLTGLVHIRNNAQLENDVRFTVYATDRSGEGLTSSLELLVKIIDTSHIAVVTVRDAFLSDEENILSKLSDSVGYEIKALKATVVSEAGSEEVNWRKRREAIISTGASLQLYVYGLMQREPVEVKQLTEDISSVQGNIDTVIIASTVSLEDHLENLAICSLQECDAGLLISTIVLAVLLFILIVAAAVWFFLKWRKEKNYEQFSDSNSLASQDDSLKPTPKPEPRMNIEELKRSEKRLQDMLDAPVTEITVEPTTSKVLEKNLEAKVSISEPPLVIQSIDKLKAVDDDSEDEDEFGERKKAKRKSVVTFNENVEKIIHVEDTPTDDDKDFEVYRL